MPHRVVVPPSASILLIEDDPALSELLVEGLAQHGHRVEAAGDGNDALAAFEARDFDVVLTDLNVHGVNGLEICRTVVARRPDVPVLVLTGHGTLETAVSAIRAGAYDFLTKPIEIDGLLVAVNRALQHRAYREEIKRLRTALAASEGFDDLVGESAPMKRLYELLQKVAQSDASTLISGESGTGKELAARAIHQRGPRKDRPFIAINCAAMPEALLESELFGHARGAFTDAKTAKVGLFVQANGGTLFLDEVGDMPISLQPKLLRVLQERKVRPVGGSSETPIDVRVISATHRDLEEEVEERRFREDLYFRLNVIHVDLPPLRSRGSDVLLLAQKFLEHHAKRAGRAVLGLTPAAAEKLTAYSWPGNVRELQNCMERAVALTTHDRIAPDDLPAKVLNHQPSHVVVASDDPSELQSLEEVERRYILRVLEAVAGNKAVAARVLKLDRKTLYRKLAHYGVHRSASDDE